MASNDFKKLAEDLERQELEAPNGVASPEVYEQLMCIYLHENELSHLRYLWSRMPPSLKTGNPRLNCIWLIAQHLFQRDFPATFEALNAVAWPESVEMIMKLVKENVTKRVLNLIAQAYSSIKLECISGMTGLPLDVCTAICQERGWLVEADTGIVHPVKPDTLAFADGEDGLEKLRTYASFFEN